MNRKQKIVVSITGVCLVLLILTGLTYGYYLTQITPNTKETSISVQTANLKLTYSDSNADIIDNNDVKLRPVTELTTDNRLGRKTFAITNDGDTTEYVILIENVKIKDAANKYTTFDSNDFVYDLTCFEVGNPNYSLLNEEKKIFPLSDSVIGTPLTINEDEIHTCYFNLWYKDNGYDQSSDMNKTLEARINIEDVHKINPYKNKTNSLAYNIINNAMNVTNQEINNNYAAFRRTPLTTPQVDTAIGEASLAVAPDDYTNNTGFNSYYYRGNASNNYVDFNGMCWRIVRIEGDGSIKLILQDQGSPCITAGENWDIGSGYFHQTEIRQGSANYDTSTIKTVMDTWYNTNFTSVDSKVKTDTVCMGDYDSSIENGPYGNIERLKYPTFKCSDYEVSIPESGSTKNFSMVKAADSKISPLTVDEAIFSGLSFYETSSFNYLQSYLIGRTSNQWWLITPSGYMNGLHLNTPGVCPSDCVLSAGTQAEENGVEVVERKYRPTITLKPGIELISLSSNGTKDNAYKV